MLEKKDFPHELGLILGYPPEDVEGFVSQQEKTAYTQATGRFTKIRKQRKHYLTDSNMQRKPHPSLILRDQDERDHKCLQLIKSLTGLDPERK